MHPSTDTLEECRQFRGKFRRSNIDFGLDAAAQIVAWSSIDDPMLLMREVKSIASLLKGELVLAVGDIVIVDKFGVNDCMFYHEQYCCAEQQASHASASAASASAASASDAVMRCDYMLVLAKPVALPGKEFIFGRVVRIPPPMTENKRGRGSVLSPFPERRSTGSGFRVHSSSIGGLSISCEGSSVPRSYLVHWSVRPAMTTDIEPEYLISISDSVRASFAKASLKSLEKVRSVHAKRQLATHGSPTACMLQLLNNPVDVCYKELIALCEARVNELLAAIPTHRQPAATSLLARASQSAVLKRVSTFLDVATTTDASESLLDVVRRAIVNDVTLVDLFAVCKHLVQMSALLAYLSIAVILGALVYVHRSYKRKAFYNRFRM
jgi:hypothetical protein